MNFSEVVILIPSHSLEDFPSELGEKPAASLLNVFAVAWHPALLLETQCLPKWLRADTFTIEQAGRRIFEDIIAVASGKKTSSEIYDYGDNEFVPWQVGAIT